MTHSERNYDACGRETQAVFFALRHFRACLLFTEQFTLRSDHRSLKDAFKKDLHGLLARWLDLFLEYEFVIEYKPGKENIPPDFLSRHDGDPVPKDNYYNGGEIGLFADDIGGYDAVNDE